MALANNAWATRQNYLRAIRAYMLHTGKLPEQSTVDEIKAHLVYTRDTLGLSSSSVNLRVCGLKYYLREVVNRLDLVVNIPNPRIQKYHTEVLTVHEVQQLFKGARDIRKLLVLKLIYDTGLRVREVVRLRVCDFDKHHKTISVLNSKGKKTRVVAYGDELRQTLKQYCKVLGYVPANTLIESIKVKGNPISTRGVQHIVKEAVKRSGLKKRIHPHTLRHTFAVHYLNFGGSLFRLQQLLGHQYISTTLHYLKYAKLPVQHKISILDELEALK